MNTLQNRFMAAFLCFSLVAVASIGQAEATPTELSGSSEEGDASGWKIELIHSIGLSLIFATKALIGGVVLEEPSATETPTGNRIERNPTTIGLVLQAAVVSFVTQVPIEALFYFLSQRIALESDPSLPAAKEKLASYLALSPQGQAEFLSVNQTVVFDLLPALRSEGRLKSFVESEGLKSLGSAKLIPLLSNTLAGIPKPELLIEQDFFQKLDRETKINIVFLASPRNYYLKKSYFMSLDIARNLLLWKYILGQSLAGLVIQEITLVNAEQVQAFLDVVEQISGHTVRAGIRDPAIYNILPRLEAISQRVRPYGLAAFTLSFVRGISVADGIIIDTYGGGMTGLTRGSVKMIVYPAIDVYQAFPVALS